jgi:hypothetical protein
MVMFFGKWLLVLGLLATGTVFLLTGLGMEVPAFKYQGFEGQRVPAGVVLLIAAITLAALWRVTSTTSVKEIKPDGTRRETVRYGKGSLIAALQAGREEDVQKGTRQGVERTSRGAADPGAGDKYRAEIPYSDGAGSDSLHWEDDPSQPGHGSK